MKQGFGLKKPSKSPQTPHFKKKSFPEQRRVPLGPQAWDEGQNGVRGPEASLILSLGFF